MVKNELNDRLNVIETRTLGQPIINIVTDLEKSRRVDKLPLM